MKIILGVFGESYQKLRDAYNLVSYGRFDYDKEKPVNEIFEDNKFLSMINYQINICDECYFDITNVKFQLNMNSFTKVTIQELLLVITTPEYLDKTIFFKEGVEFSKEEVLNWFLFDNYWNTYL